MINVHILASLSYALAIKSNSSLNVPNNAPFLLYRPTPSFAAIAGIHDSFAREASDAKKDMVYYRTKCSGESGIIFIFFLIYGTLSPLG